MLSEPQATTLLSALAGLIRTSRTITSKAHGTSITGTQISVLRILAPGEARMGDLAGRLMVAPSVASRVVAGLEHEGLVTRHPDPADARACLLSLTDLGAERLAEREHFALGLVQEVLADWNDEDAATVASLVNRLESRVPDFTARMLDQPELSRRPLSELSTNSADPRAALPHQHTGSSNTSNLNTSNLNISNLNTSEMENASL